MFGKIKTTGKNQTKGKQYDIYKTSLEQIKNIWIVEVGNKL